MIPSPVLAWRRFILTENSISSSAWWFRCWVLRFHVQLHILSWCWRSWVARIRVRIHLLSWYSWCCLTRAANIPLMWFLFLFGCRLQGMSFVGWFGSCNLLPIAMLLILIRTGELVNSKKNFVVVVIWLNDELRRTPFDCSTAVSSNFEVWPPGIPGTCWQNETSGYLLSAGLL